MKTFSELGLSGQILTTLKEVGYDQPTEIQGQTIDLILQGRDIVASAQTGSGKTAAYALPLIEKLGAEPGLTRALVIVPTRELALQVTQQFKLLGKHCRVRAVCLYGGVGFDKQIRDLRPGVEVIVATPGRLLDCVARKLVDLSQLQVLVLDEADRLLDMGFMPQVRRIIAGLPRQRQTLMFSATVDQRIEYIAGQFLRQPLKIKSDIERVEPAEIDQKLIRVHEFSKDELLLTMLGQVPGSALVFARTRRKATWVADRLRDALVPAEEIHGDISQNQRERTLKGFRQGTFRVLVATDVAARGLDIPAISHVFNYDVPDSPEDYVHRIGRTGRAGRSGTAITFVSEEQQHLVRGIEKIIGRPLEPGAPRPTKSVAGRRFRSGARRRA